jgi:hypothetical protein
MRDIGAAVRGVSIIVQDLQVFDRSAAEETVYSNIHALNRSTIVIVSIQTTRMSMQ